MKYEYKFEPRRYGKTHNFKKEMLLSKKVPNVIKAQIQFETLNKLKPLDFYTA